MPFMLHVIAPLVADFRAQYPQIELELNTSDRIIDLLEEDTDVAIRIGALRDSTLRARRLGTRRLRVLASPAYLKAHGRPRTVDALRHHALLGFVQPESLNHSPLRTATACASRRRSRPPAARPCGNSRCRAPASSAWPIS